MTYKGMIGKIFKDRSMEAEKYFARVWVFRDFPLLSTMNHDHYYSPEFRINNENWHLILYPSRTIDSSRGSPSKWVTLGLRRYDGGSPKTFHICINAWGSKGKLKEFQLKWEFSGYDSFIKDVCTRSQLMEQIPDGILLIVCAIKEMPSAVKDMYNKNDSYFDTFAGVKQSLENKGCEKLHDDFAELLLSRERSDVTVLVSGVEFKVHKLILFVRCPAIAVLLEHESEEKVSNKIIIEDCEPNIFEDFLYYLYTGSLLPLNEQSVYGLYRVAAKYLVEDLKQHCLEHIHDILSVQTCCNSLRLALRYGENDLLQKATDLAVKKMKQIILLKDWHNFLNEYPKEALEIMMKHFHYKRLRMLFQKLTRKLIG